MNRKPSTTGVYRVDIAEWAARDSIGYDFEAMDRRLRFDMDMLPAGANVRLIVNKCRPIPGYTSWLRSDLNVVIEHSDYSAFLEWHDVHAGTGVAA